MANKTNSFVYQQNGLPVSKSRYDVYCALVERYQKNRTDEKWPTGDLDDHQLIRERYTDRPTFISHTQPIDASTLLFVNRQNGYLAFTDTIPTTPLNPVEYIDPPTVNTFFEYLSRIKDTPGEGFFYRQSQLSCYTKITDDIYVIMPEGEIPLLFFAESFHYVEDVDDTTGRVGIATLSSPYYNDMTVEVYTEDSLTTLEPYFVYIKTSDNDPHPTNKIPGEPIYKTLVISQWDSTVTKIEIDGVEVDLTSPTGIITKDDERFHHGYLGFKYDGGGEIELGFNLPFKDDPLLEVTLQTRLLINDEWTELKETTLYLNNNVIHSLTPTITIDPQDLYLSVPTEYTLRIDKRYYYTVPPKDTVTTLIYLDNSLTSPLHYQDTSNDQSVYKTDYVTVPQEEGKKPNEFLFVVEDVYDKVNGFEVPVWLYGYTTNEVNRIPDDFILVTPDPKADFEYTEYEKHTYPIDFSYRGTLTLKDVEIKRVSDDYGYFQTSDFTIEKLSESADTLSYQLVIDKKIIATPQDVSEIPLRFLFSYKVMRKDLSELYWPADTLTVTMKIHYEEQRFELIVDDVSNKLLGDTTIRYRIKDKFLDVFTDRYSDDERLVLKGGMVYSDNVEPISEVMDWDIRNKQYLSRVNILSYGDITIQFKGLKTTSNVVTLNHDEPTHPLVVSANIHDVYTDTLCRVVLNLKYNDLITAIYNDGNFIGYGTSIALDNVKNGNGGLFPIYTPDKKQITGLGVDFIPLQEGEVTANFIFNGVNDYDYSNWPKYFTFTVPVKPQSDIINFTFEIQEFSFGKVSKALLKFNDERLADGKVIATVKNAANDVIVAKPNFNPIGGGDFTTINLFIDDYLSDQKAYYLDFEINEYLNASKDDNAPNRFYYHVKIPFEVP